MAPGARTRAAIRGNFEKGEGVVAGRPLRQVYPQLETRTSKIYDYLSFEEG